MLKRCIHFLIILSAIIFAIPAMAQETGSDKDFARGADEEMVTRLGTVKVGMPKDKLYEIFQNQDRIFAHKVLGEEWIVFRNWASDNPKTDVITIYLVDGLVAGWKNAFVPSPKNEGSIYEYKPDEKITAWFFPAGESRWDGTDMNVQEWNMLTDTQKVMFVTEYIKQLEPEAGEHIAIDAGKYILALNYYADTCSTAYISKRITDVIKGLLTSEGKIKTEDKALESPAMQHATP